MAELSWIKLSIDIFSNRKIAILMNEKEGDAYFRIWVQLLTIAGQCNMQGRLVIGENIPLDIEQLSKILRKNVKKVQEIMTKFVDLRMINYQDNCFSIRNWGKYQSADKLEEIRKSNRERQRKFREKNKVGSHVIETLDNALE